MCTVTIVPFREAPFVEFDEERRLITRIACNRDESPARAPAQPPVVKQFGPCRAMLPIDAESGGTWIAANDAGLVFSLLNVNNGETSRFPRGENPRTSRGLVITQVLDCTTLEEAAERLSLLEIVSFAPFRFVATDGDRYFNFASDEASKRVEICRLSQPVIFTSSGLGDGHVQAPRAALFRRFFSNNDISAARQDAFHRHQWPDRPELSVCMRRSGAETVSYTTLEIWTDGVVMNYFGASPDRSTNASTRVLPIQTRMLR